MRCLVSLFVFLLVLLNSVCFAAPVFNVDSNKFDFGEVFQGEKVPHVFKFTNDGDEILKIDRVKSSCGCTAVLLSEKTIPPGGVGEIKANFDSSRFRGDTSKVIYVYTNDPVNATRQLYIKGKVLEKVLVTPAQVNFGTVAAKQQVTSRVTLKNQVAQAMKIDKAKATAAELIVKMQPVTLQQGEEAVIELTLTPKPGRPRFSGYVLVPIKGVPRNELRIPVYATIKN